MHRLSSVQQILLVVQSAAEVFLVIRFWWTGLYRVYVYFFAYLVANVVQSAVLGSVPYSGVFYRYAWTVTEFLINCCLALTVLELYSIVLKDHPGIASLSRRYIKVTLGLAVVVSLMLLPLEKVPKGVVVASLIFERATLSSLAIFVLLMAAFLAYYPVQLSRNVIFYSIGYAVYFLTKATARLIENLSNHWYAEFDILFVGVSTACMLLWLFTISRKGETKTAVIGHRWKRADEERLLAQLKAINASLSRSRQK
jgi:hypothetical protein